MASDNPFKKIDKSRFPKSQRDKRVQEILNPPEPTAEEKKEVEQDLFSQAMSGVEPLEKTKGRAVAPEAPLENSPRPQPEGDEDARAMNELIDLVEGKSIFELEYSEEYIQGHVKGISPKMLARLKTGKLSPEAHLDLHGMNAMQAYESLFNFIRNHYLHGKRCLLLIPGRGKNSPEGYGVLREKVRIWLTRDPFKRVVLAFVTALPRHGGAGALYVLLRKYKKSRGKIIWERMPRDPDAV